VIDAQCLHTILAATVGEIDLVMLASSVFSQYGLPHRFHCSTSNSFRLFIASGHFLHHDWTNAAGSVRDRMVTGQRDGSDRGRDYDHGDQEESKSRCHFDDNTNNHLFTKMFEKYST